jgi:hypothetical protein
MKKLKKLNNEKTILGKKFYENRDNNTNMKNLLDEKIKKYEILQGAFDDASDDDKIEMEGSMSDLLYIIGIYMFLYVYLFIYSYIYIYLCKFMCIRICIIYISLYICI